MKDLGHYKKTTSKTYHCHFDDNKKIALPIGPLPELTVYSRVEADNERDAARKLAQKTGNGVFTSFVLKG